MGSGPPINSPEWLGALLREKCQVQSVYEHQLVHGMDLVNGKDLFLVIATGKGKTIVLHAPLIAAQSRGETGIALLIVPTKILVDQQAQIAAKHGLRAYGMHEDSVRDASLKGHDLFGELEGGTGIRVGVMSPQMLQGWRLSKLLNDIRFKRLVRWLFIDEAHLVNEASSTFLTVYRSITNMRVRLPSTTIWAAVTGTATPDDALSIARSLGFQTGHYVNARYTIDRPNIKYIPRFFEHPTSGSNFLDLSFLIPFNMTSVDELAPTLIFCTTINTGYRLMQFLDHLIPLHIPNRLEIVKLYNSLMPADYRKAFIRDMQDGSKLRIGIATDTCTYGLDIPSLRRVILFDLCPSPENLKQKIGRPGRDGAPAEAITFAPAWVREQPVENIVGKKTVEDLKRRTKLPEVTRQWYNPTLTQCSRHADLQYNGEKYVPYPNCCVTCDPEPEQSRDYIMVQKWVKYFDDMRVKDQSRIKTLRTDGTYLSLEKHMKESLLQMLTRWRGQKWATIRGPERRGLPADVFLPLHVLNHIVERAHICSDLERLRVVCRGWDYIEEYGIELLQFLGKAMAGFQDLYKERTDAKEDPGHKGETQDFTPISNTDTSRTKISHIRLVLGAKGTAEDKPVVSKRALIQPHSTIPTKRAKHSQSSDKENQPE